MNEKIKDARNYAAFLTYSYNNVEGHIVSHLTFIVFQIARNLAAIGNLGTDLSSQAHVTQVHHKLKFVDVEACV